MFQDRVKKTIFPASQAHSDSLHSIRGQGKLIRTSPKRLPTDLPSPPTQSHAGRRKSTAPTPQAVQEIWLTYGTGFLRFPCSNFRYYLTIFSKFFASFPHGTCALSVSHKYLAPQDGFGKEWFLGLLYTNIFLTTSLHKRYTPLSRSVSSQQIQWSLVAQINPTRT